MITGEWCQEVMDDYLRYPEALYAYPTEHLRSTMEVKAEKDLESYYHKEFAGRGVQYYLGFHHGRHQCRGWIATTDSHYLYSTLGTRGMSAYFLGCPMSEYIEESIRILYDHFFAEQKQGPSSNTEKSFVNIEKVRENIV